MEQELHNELISIQSTMSRIETKVDALEVLETRIRMLESFKNAIMTIGTIVTVSIGAVVAYFKA